MAAAVAALEVCVTVSAGVVCGGGLIEGSRLSVAATDEVRTEAVPDKMSHFSGMGGDKISLLRKLMSPSRICVASDGGGM